VLLDRVEPKVLACRVQVMARSRGACVRYQSSTADLDGVLPSKREIRFALAELC